MKKITLFAALIFCFFAVSGFVFFSKNEVKEKIIRGIIEKVRITFSVLSLRRTKSWFPTFPTSRWSGILYSKNNRHITLLKVVDNLMMLYIGMVVIGCPFYSLLNIQFSNSLNTAISCVIYSDNVSLKLSALILALIPQKFLMRFISSLMLSSLMLVTNLSYSISLNVNLFALQKAISTSLSNK